MAKDASSGSMLGNVSPAVLANVGVPIFLYRTRVENTEHKADESEAVEHKLKFTNWTISQLEDEFSSMSRWDQSMSDQPFRTVIRTLALVLGWPAQRVAAAMPMGHVTEYQLAIHAALQIALGADPKKVAKALNDTMGMETTEETGQTVETFATRMDGFPGTDSGSTGSATAETPTSSGPSPQDSTGPSPTRSPW